MFQTRQFSGGVDEYYEVSFAPSVSPGAITTGSVASVTVACVIGSVYSANKAAFVIGDLLKVIVPVGAAPIAGCLVSAQPTSTAGTCIISFANCSGSTITPTSANYIIIANRALPTAF
jgi:hypothetical protein